MKQGWWVIFGYVSPDDAQPLFWSNGDGWVSLESATIFSNKERVKYGDRLPDTGMGMLASWAQLP